MTTTTKAEKVPKTEKVSKMQEPKTQESKPKKEKVSKKTEAVQQKSVDVDVPHVAVKEETVDKNTVIASPSPSSSSSSNASLSDDLGSFFAKLQGVYTSLSTLKSEFRVLEKKYSRQFKSNQKASSKKKSSVNRAPSGFVQPTLISDELASFLKKEKGSKMARTEVTREINAYIREHKLQDKTNGRRINADDSLSALLKMNKDDELTYFNLQRYMSPHFAKNVKAVPALAASV